MHIDRTTHESPFDLFAETSWYVVERRILDKDWISDEEIDAILGTNSDRPVPMFFKQYLCDRTAGKSSKKRGPKPMSALRTLWMAYTASVVYPKLMMWLQKKKKAGTLPNFPYIRDADWWQGPPSERAARMICHRIRKDYPMSYRSFLNNLSKRGTR